MLRKIVANKSNTMILDEWVYDTTYFYDHDHKNGKYHHQKWEYRTIGNYCVFGNVKAKTRIMTYGGSTTCSISGSKWAEFLQQEFRNSGKDVCVFNGGCCGHGSWHELNKMMRDIPTFKPNLVISFSGINDFYWGVNPKHPYNNTKLNKEIISTNIFKKVNFPITTEDHADVWITRGEYMNAICSAKSSNFLRIIQPTLGFGDYKFDMDDELDRSFYNRINHIGTKIGVDQFTGEWEMLNSFYTKLTQVASTRKRNYLFDLTLLFDGLSRKFADYRHPNPDGYRIIAKAIKNIIDSQKYFNYPLTSNR